jgi:O-antigen/teichoic acid export membrane protein
MDPAMHHGEMKTALERPATQAGRIVRNSMLNFGGYVLNAGCNLLALCILARRMPVETFGAYYALYAMVMLLQLVLEAGVPTVLTCRISVARERWKTTAAEATGLLFLAMLVTIATCLLGGFGYGLWTGRDGWFSVALLVALAVSSMHVQRYCAGILQGFERFGLENAAKVTQSCLFAVMATLLVPAGQSGLALPLGLFGISQAVAALCLVVAVQTWRRSFAVRLTPRLVADWLRDAGPLGTGDLVRRFTHQMDVMILALLQPAAIVAIYTVAARPLAALNWLPYVVLTATLPSFARLAYEDRAALRRAFSVSLRLLWITSLPIAISIFASAATIVRVMAPGSDFAEAAGPLRILIWIAVLIFLSVPFRFLFAALGKSRLYLVLVISATIVEAGSQVLLIPRLDYRGACLGAMIGELYFVVAGSIACWKLNALEVEWHAMGRASLAGAAMAAVFLIPHHDSMVVEAILVAVAIGFYFVLCATWGALRPEETRHCLEALRGFLRPAPQPVHSVTQMQVLFTEPNGDRRDEIPALEINAAAQATGE